MLPHPGHAYWVLVNETSLRYPPNGSVAQRDAGMIIHMHLCAAAVAGKILVISLKRTGKADHSPAGYRQTGGG